MTHDLPRPLYWVSGAKDELKALPQQLVRNFGYALSAVQFGRSPPTSVKHLRGYGVALLELRDNGEAGTYRVIYTVALPEAVYVLHCFQKKSHVDGKLPKETIALIKTRLKTAKAHHEQAHSRD